MWQRQIQQSMGVSLRSLGLVAAVGAWITGIVLESYLSIPPLLLLGTAILVLIFAMLSWKHIVTRFVVILLLCIAAGAWRYTNVLPDSDPQSIVHAIGSSTVEIQGTVTDEPRLSARTRLLTVEVDQISFQQNSSWQPAHGIIEVQTMGTQLEDDYGANYGDMVTLQGKLTAPSIYSLHGTQAEMSFPRVEVNQNVGNPIIAFLYHLRARYATIIAQTLPQPMAALLTAIVLGLHTPDLAALTSAFNVTGTAHLIAPSGFKVSLIANFAIISTRWLYKGRLARQLPGRKSIWYSISTMLVIISIATYTILSGAGPAAIRAGIMGSLLVIAPRIGRTYNVYTALAFTALLMSLQDPFVLWDVSFLLSFLGTLGIILLTPHFQRLLQPLTNFPGGSFMNEMISVTMAAQLATLPIFALSFQQISFISPLANILTVPLLGILITLGFLICGIGLFSISLATVCGWVAWPLLWYMSNSILWCSSLPGAYINVQNIDAQIGWFYYALLIPGVICLLIRSKQTPYRLHKPYATTITRQTQRIMLVACACLIVLITGIATLQPQATGKLSITFLNVGSSGKPSQGEAIFIRTADGKTLLIDGGPDPVTLAQKLDSRLPSWQRTLDMVILTDPQTDYITGLQDIVSRYNIQQIIDGGMLHPSTTYARWRRTISEHHLRYESVKQGQSIHIDEDTQVEILWPPTQLHKGSNEIQDNSLILRLVAPGLQLLLLGTTAQSRYALTGLLDSIPVNSLQAAIVQIIGETEKTQVSALMDVLQEAHPSLLVIMPAAHHTQSNTNTAFQIQQTQQALTIPGLQEIYSDQSGDLTVTATGTGWNMSTSR
jgi:competence protein ComEC